MIVHSRVLKKPMLALTLVLIMFSLSCGKPPIFTVEIDSQTEKYYFNKYKVLVDGHEVVTSTGERPLVLEITGHNARTPEKMLSGVEAQVFSVCGWKKPMSAFLCLTAMRSNALARSTITRPHACTSTLPTTVHGKPLRCWSIIAEARMPAWV